MPGMNLTRAEAATRADLLTVNSYDVTLDLTTGETHFASTTVLRFESAHVGASTFVDLVDASNVNLTFNGQVLDPAVYADSRIELSDLQTSNELIVHADLPYSRTGEGLHRFVDPADDRVYLYSQFEVPDARRVYANFEQPDLKSTFTFTVTAPEHWVVVSNSPTPSPSYAGDGTATWYFPATKPISTYITAIVAGEYYATFDTYEGMSGPIPLGHYCRQSLRDHLDIDELLEVTKQGFEFFERTFQIPYAFGKYDQLYVPEYNMGAMENAGAVTFRDELLPRSRQVFSFYEQRANTILHEMAHMWFGNLVTMKWWDDLWLNESFAEWASHHAMAHATKYCDVWTGFTNARKNWAYRQDQLPSTHPIAADNVDLHAVEVNFDGITYAKGASTLKQLVAWVGVDEFIAGLREYFTDHAWGNTTFSDLLRALETASGRELSSWAQEWLQTSGVNTLVPQFTVTAGAYSSFAVEQHALPDFPTLRRHRIGIGLYDLIEGQVVLRERLDVDISGARTDIAELVGQRQPDLLLLNDGDLSYAKIRLDEHSLRVAIAHIGAVSDSLTRALLWGAAWDMTRDADMSASDFVTLVLAGLRTETDSTAVARLPGYVRTAIAYYAAPHHREQLRARWEAGLRELVLDAVAGSDRQLSFARAFAASAYSEDGLTLVQELLSGDRVLPGLTIDTDLRWSLVTALSRHAVFTEADIAAEESADRTISGQERAGLARAVHPSAAAKAHAWHAAIERDDLPNETQRQIAAGFATAGQADVLAPYLDKYLEAAQTLWETKGVQRASTALILMFPMPLVSAETLATIDHWLATSTANAAAKRYVREGAADMARALAAQARDA